MIVRPTAIAISFSILAACGGSLDPVPLSAPDTEPCNGFDDDGDGLVDEGCPCAVGQSQACYPGPVTKLLGQCAAGEQRCEATAEFGTWGACEGAVLPQQEVCGNGIDEDCDGNDEPCPGECTPGETRACYDGPAQTEGVGLCQAGSQLCLPSGQWDDRCQGAVLPGDEICENGLDEDCDGNDEPCPVVTVTIALEGDCLTARCPAEAPHPIGCHIIFGGGDHRGCVASKPDDPVLYFQEGDWCGAGSIQGELHCASKPGPPLDAVSCPMNKPTRIYVASKDQCPELKD